VRTRKMFEASHARLAASLSNESILSGLKSVHAFVTANRIFEALKALRVLFPIEDAILSNSATLAPSQNR
jgi:flagellar protein FlbT